MCREADEREVALAAGRLREGRLVAFPTETVYGLAADALNPQAIARVFLAKGRPANNPLIVHVEDAAAARRVTAAWPKIADSLAHRFWPGPLTIVLPRHPAVPDAVTAGGPTVAVRVPDHPVATALLRAFGGPLVAPSANPSGYVSPTRAEHVREHFDEEEVLTLDGGPCPAGIESTVVDVMGETITILRPGVITATELEDAHPVAPRTTISCAKDTPTRPRSPGMLNAHYQPHASVVLASTLTEVDALLNASANTHPGAPTVIIAPPGTPLAVEPPNHAIPMPADARAYAAELYAALREADALSPASIIIAVPASETGVWEAIHNRLRRAAAPA
ncbi:MAG: L-threonylcarbamoyladenylate synthase [Planctomycetota bacterium]